MNAAELKALQGSVSNDARVLYFLGIRPTANPNSGITQELNYKNLTTLLNSTEQHYTRGRQLNRLILELNNHGLIDFITAIEPEKSFNKQKLLLPLLVLPTDDYASLHQHKQAISAQWQPTKHLYNNIVQLVGMLEKEYYNEDVGEFVAYWLGRPDAQFTQYQWTHKFVLHLRKTRLAAGYTATTQIGTQTVNKKPELTADDNTKKLVEKYRGKH